MVNPYVSNVKCQNMIKNVSINIHHITTLKVNALAITSYSLAICKLCQLLFPKPVKQRTDKNTVSTLRQHSYVLGKIKKKRLCIHVFMAYDRLDNQYIKQVTLTTSSMYTNNEREIPRNYV